MKKLFLTSLVVFSSIACTRQRAPEGSAENPLKLFFLPSVDAKVIEDKSAEIKAYLEKNTPYKYSVAVPTSYIAVVEAFGTKRADIASLNSFGYILANEKYGVEAWLTVIRFGSPTYRAQIITRADSQINSLNDLQGKKFAFVDAASTSGYLLPMKLFNEKGIKLGDTMFANKHDNVVSMVYNRQVDAGATFYSPPEDGKIQDARRLVLTQYPDVEQKVKILELTEPIPNDPIVFRKDLPNELKETVVKALLEYIKTEEGRTNFHALYGVTEFVRAKDSDYDSVRQMLRDLGQDPAKLMK